MPTYTDPNTFGAIPHDTQRLEKVPLRISSEMHSKGKSATKGHLGESTVTDDQFINAEIASAALVPSIVSLPIPTPEQQGSEGSCVSFATAYACLSVEWYKFLASTSYDRGVNVFSPEYLFDQVQSGSCSGSALLTSFDFIKNNGCVLWNTLPYSWLDGCTISPSVGQLAEAASYRINNYSIVLNSDIAGIKSIINEGHAIAFLLVIDSPFYHAGPGFIWSATTADGSIAGYHSMAIVGYDDSKNAFKVINSYGTTWGDSGISYIDYDFFATGGNITSQMLFITGLGGSIVTNKAPIANAGADQTILSNGTAVLDGTASYDPDGTIASYLWAKVSGPSSPAIVNSTSPVASIAPTVAGTYVYSLTVTDNSTSPLTATDTVTITVNAAVVETLTLYVSKTVAKGKTTDKLTWSITLANPPIAAELQVGSSSTSFGTLYKIIPYTAQGTYSYLVSKSTVYRYYRLKVIKSDGTVIYQISSPQSIK